MRLPTVVRRWEEGGLDCALARRPLTGVLLGYVRLPSGHPWHGLGLDDPVPNPQPPDEAMTVAEAMEDYGVVPVAFGGPEPTLRWAVRVHGGLTWAGPLGHVGPGWWIGFDCGHGGEISDAIDPEHCAPELREHALEMLARYPEQIYLWTEDEAALEVKRLAAAARAGPE